MKKTYVNKKGKTKTYTEKSFNDYYVIDLLAIKHLTRFWYIHYLKSHMIFTLKRRLSKLKRINKKPRIKL